MDLYQRVETYIRRHRLLSAGDAVVVGVSGGPDSVALLDLLRRLAETWELRLHVAHLHHGIRGADADADASFVAALAERYGLPCTVERISLPDIARREKLALEETARRVRYAFLARTAQAVGAETIAVGHNAGDQAETVLMHLLRGAGPAGLRGMLPATLLRDYRLLPLNPPPDPALRLIRPLLEVTRAEIEAYCSERGLQTRCDRSNLDTTFFRNRLRHEVLPYLARIHPQIAARLRNLAEVVRADYELLEGITTETWNRLLVETHADALAFDLAGWRAAPLSLQRALLRRAAYRLRRTLRDVDFVHVANALRIAQDGVTGARATLPRDLVATVGYTTLTIGDIAALHLPPERPWLEPGNVVPLVVPGVTPLPGGWTVTAEVLTAWEPEAITANPDPLTVWLDAQVLGAHPLLRARQRGERFCPQGMGGVEVKLSDFLVNVKLPRAWRAHLPLLEAGGRLLWVVGLRLSEVALVRPASRRVARLNLQCASEESIAC